MNILISENFIWMEGLALSSLKLSSHFSSILSFEEKNVTSHVFYYANLLPNEI